MNIHFITVSQETIKQAIALEVLPAQVGFVESVKESYNESLQFSFWKPVMIFDDANPIGFAMYGLYPSKKGNEVWLDRFFIDQKKTRKRVCKSCFVCTFV